VFVCVSVCWCVYVYLFLYVHACACSIGGYGQAVSSSGWDQVAGQFPF